MDRGRLIHIVIFIVFVGIPTSATFYPPIVSRFTDQLQLGPVDIWIGRLGVILVVLYLGRRLLGSLGGSKLIEGASIDATYQNLDTIEGCIEKAGVAWRGIIHLKRGQVERVEVPFDPLCPKCQTGFIDTTEEPSPREQRQNPSYSPNSQPTPVFKCPNDNCGHTVGRDSEQYDAVKKLFERHARQIVESTGEDYSLRSLIKKSRDGETPNLIWEEYAEVVDDEQVSTNCFH